MTDLDEAFRQAQRQRVRAGFAELGARLGSTERGIAPAMRPWRRGDPIDMEAIAKIEAGFSKCSEPVVLSEAARQTFAMRPAIQPEN
jgi:hypothetical protein